MRASSKNGTSRGNERPLGLACMRVSFFIMFSIFSLNSGLFIRPCAMFWNAGLLNMLFIAAGSNPGGIPGAPPSPSPPRRRIEPIAQAEMAEEHMDAATWAATSRSATRRHEDILPLGAENVTFCGNMFGFVSYEPASLFAAQWQDTLLARAVPFQICFSQCLLCLHSQPNSPRLPTTKSFSIACKNLRLLTMQVPSLFEYTLSRPL